MHDNLVTLIIIAVTCVISFKAFSDRRLLDRLILWPPAITQRGEYWRLFTCGLIHADMTHLLFNMFTLYFFGGFMEQFFNRHLGEAGFLLFYVGGLGVSCLPSYLRHKADPAYRSLGASGAVSAALFAFILLRPWSKILIFGAVPVPAVIFAALYLAYTIYMDRRRSDHINHSAHLWGAIYGIAVTALVEPRSLDGFLYQVMRAGA